MYFRGSATAVFVLFPMSSIKVPSIVCGARYLGCTYAEIAIARCAIQVRARCGILGLRWNCLHFASVEIADINKRLGPNIRLYYKPLVSAAQTPSNVLLLVILGVVCGMRGI